VAARWLLRYLEDCDEATIVRNRRALKRKVA
jgi:hypothetical protein